MHSCNTVTLTVAVVHQVRQLDIAEAQTACVADDVLKLRIRSCYSVASILAEVLQKLFSGKL